MLNKMTPGNFDWCLHALLFIHTERVIKTQKQKAAREQGNQDAEEDEDTEREGFDVEQDDEEIFPSSQ